MKYRCLWWFLWQKNTFELFLHAYDFWTKILQTRYSEVNGLMTSLQYSTYHSNLKSCKNSSLASLSIPSSSNQVQPAIPATNLAIGREFWLIQNFLNIFFIQMKCVAMGWQTDKLRIGASKMIDKSESLKCNQAAACT